MKSKSSASPVGFQLVLIGLLTMFVPSAQAVFDVAVSPPRFELKSEAGGVLRDVLLITNGSGQPGRYSVKSADWWLDDRRQVQFNEGTPKADSCRSWIRLERREISVAPRATRNFRFEVHVPKSVKVGECRFAILISGEAQKISDPSGRQQIQLPLVGRIGVIVYVTIGDAKPVLRLTRLYVDTVDRKTVPFAVFRNSGNAHGRVFGSLEAKDAKGRQVELIAGQEVILPKDERAIPLNPADYSTGESRKPEFNLAPPMHVRGKLQFFGGGEVVIDQVIR